MKKIKNLIALLITCIMIIESPLISYADTNIDTNKQNININGQQLTITQLKNSSTTRKVQVTNGNNLVIAEFSKKNNIVKITTKNRATKKVISVSTINLNTLSDNNTGIAQILLNPKAASALVTSQNSCRQFSYKSYDNGTWKLTCVSDNHTTTDSQTVKRSTRNKAYLDAYKSNVNQMSDIYADLVPSLGASILGLVLSLLSKNTTVYAATLAVLGFNKGAVTDMMKLKTYTVNAINNYKLVAKYS